MHVRATITIENDSTKFGKCLIKLYDGTNLIITENCDIFLSCVQQNDNRSAVSLFADTENGTTH